MKQTHALGLSCLSALLCGGLLIALSAALNPEGVNAQTLQQNLPVTNGTVYGVTFDPGANIIYIGGEFTYVGPHTGNGAAIDVTTGNVDPAFPKVNGAIYAVAPDGSGGWYIGGISQTTLNFLLPNATEPQPNKKKLHAKISF